MNFLMFFKNLFTDKKKAAIAVLFTFCSLILFSNIAKVHSDYTETENCDHYIEIRREPVVQKIKICSSGVSTKKITITKDFSSISSEDAELYIKLERDGTVCSEKTVKIKNQEEEVSVEIPKKSGGGVC